MLGERIGRGRAHGRGVVAVDGFCGRRSEWFAVLKRLPEFMAGMVGLQDVDVHILIGLADTAETEGSGWSGPRVGCRQSWVRCGTWARVGARAWLVKPLGFGKDIRVCAWYSTIREPSTGVGSLTTGARWHRHEWILGVAVVAKSWMLMHIRRFGGWGNHGLLFHTDMAGPMRRVISARLFWLV